MAEITEQALDIALDKKDVKRKRARRLEREAKRSGETPRKQPRLDKVFAREQKANSRYSRLSTSGPLLCIAATTRDFSDFTARRTIV